MTIFAKPISVQLQATPPMEPVEQMNPPQGILGSGFESLGVIDDFNLNNQNQSGEQNGDT